MPGDGEDGSIGDKDTRAPSPPAAPAAGHGKRHEPGNGEHWGGCSAGPAMPGWLVPALEVGDARLAARSATPSRVSPAGTGSGTGLGRQAACLPAGGAKSEEMQAGMLRQPAAGARPDSCPGGVEGRSDSEPPPREGWNLSQCL